MIVLGLDLSLTSTGVAVVEPGRIVTRAIKSKPAPRALRTANVRARRIGEIVRIIERDIVERMPDIAVVESPVPNRKMQSGMLLERGAIYWGTLDMLDRNGVEVIECSPRERALYATGNGAADKMSVARSMLAEHEQRFVTDDECDAFVLAMIGARLLGCPLDETVEHRTRVAANLAAQRRRSA